MQATIFIHMECVPHIELAIVQNLMNDRDESIEKCQEGHLHSIMFIKRSSLQARQPDRQNELESLIPSDRHHSLQILQLLLLRLDSPCVQL